jgi:hypothetical protein
VLMSVVPYKLSRVTNRDDRREQCASLCYEFDIARQACAIFS